MGICKAIIGKLVAGTTPKIRFPMYTYPAYQNMTFSHISYTYLAEDRVEFYENE